MPFSAFWLRTRHVGRLTAVMAALLSCVVAACESTYPATAKSSTTDAPPRQVKAVAVAQMPVERTVSVLGALAAYDQATLSAKIPGRLASITVDFGSPVEQGQVLARIEPRDYQLQVQQAEAALAQARVRLGLEPNATSDERVDPERTGTVRQARAQLEEAQKNRNRLATLVEKGFSAKSDFDNAEAALQVAQSRYQDAQEEIRSRQALLLQRRSELELARQRLADTTIRAPFDGVVQEKHASIGEYLAASAPVATVVQIDPLRLRAEVPERAAAQVQAGQKVRVTVEGNERAHEGVVMRLGPTIDIRNRMLTVEADVKNSGALRPGAFARVEIVTDGTAMAVVVPSRAIVTFAGLEKIWRVREGKVEEIPVVTGQRTAEWTEVLSGANVGDLLVLDPVNLRPGQPVSVIQ